MSYTKPGDVNSPKGRWNLIAVLDPGAAGTSSTALGTWDGKSRIGMRWNGTDDSPIGNPQSRGIPTWFLVEEKWHEAILTSGLLAQDKVVLARHFFPEKKP